MIYYLQFLGIRSLQWFLALIPLAVLYSLAELGGNLSYLFMSKRRRVALDNIEKAFGASISNERKNEIAKTAFKSAALSIVELFAIRKIIHQIDRRFTLQGNEILEKAFSKGKGVVLVISHL